MSNNYYSKCLLRKQKGIIEELQPDGGALVYKLCIQIDITNLGTCNVSTFVMSSDPCFLHYPYFLIMLRL